MSAKHYYVGNCINLFEQNGQSDLYQYPNITTFAQALENNTVKITKEQFLINCYYHSEFQMDNQTIYMYDNNTDVYIAYNPDEDIHYIYV